MPEISVTKIPAGKQTEKQKKQTITDISTTCLSACVDKKQVRQLIRLAHIHTCRSPITAKHKKFTTAAVTDHAAECFSQHTRSATVVQICRTGLTNVERVIDFSIFDLGELTPGSKISKRGDDLVLSEVYHPAKFRCPTSTHA